MAACSSGLHQRRFASPALTFVHAGVAGFAAELEARGIALETRHTSEDSFNEIGFRDPDGQSVIVLEARTYSPATRGADETSLCGYFVEFSMPVGEFRGVRASSGSRSASSPPKSRMRPTRICR